MAAQPVVAEVVVAQPVVVRLVGLARGRQSRGWSASGMRSGAPRSYTGSIRESVYRTSQTVGLA